MNRIRRQAPSFDLTFSYLPIILLNFPDSAILTSQWFKRSLKRKILVTSLENVSTCTMSSAAAQKHSGRCTQQTLCWATNHEKWFLGNCKTLGWSNPDSQGTERLGRGLQKEHTEKNEDIYIPQNSIPYSTRWYFIDTWLECRMGRLSFVELTRLLYHVHCHFYRPPQLH